MSNQASGSGGEDYCYDCSKSGLRKSNCPKTKCFKCNTNGHMSYDCPKAVCSNCGTEGHTDKDCPTAKCVLCGEDGHLEQQCICAICSRPGHNERQCSKDSCSLCYDLAHKAIDCTLMMCRNCLSEGHHARNCLGCWHCGAKEHSTGTCKRVRPKPASYPSKVSEPLTSNVTCFGCLEKGHKRDACPKEQGHNKNILRKLVKMDINKTDPNRRDLHGSLVIDPSGRGYFVNFHQKEFHWSNQFGSNIYEAQHQTKKYIDFDAGDQMNRLYYYSPTGKQQLRFQTGNLTSTRKNDLKSLQNEVSKLIDGTVEVYESERESFLVDFKDGHILLDGEKHNHVDIINFTRVNITLRHQSWKLKFAAFEALMPCRCGLVKHEDVDARKKDHNNRHNCLVETTRSYNDLISLITIRGTQIQLIDFIVDLESETHRAGVVTHSAMYQGKYLVTAEVVGSEDSVVYEEHDRLDRHSNILEFYGRKEFQEHSYCVFGSFESTLLDFTSRGNVAEHSNVCGWIRDIVEGLSWLHEKGLHHGNIRPHNIVIRDKKAMLHGLTKDGDKEDDRMHLAALMYYCFTGIPCEFPYPAPYIPSIEDCYKHLHERDPEAYDLLDGLLTSRLQVCDVLMHPKFWATQKRRDFIRVVSDQLLTSEITRGVIEGIQDDVYSRFTMQPSFKGLHAAFIGRAQHFGNLDVYGGRKVEALLRAFRNAYNHLYEKKYTDSYFGGDIDKLDCCIRELYPSLIMKTFSVLQPICKENPAFLEFFLY